MSSIQLRKTFLVSNQFLLLLSLYSHVYIIYFVLILYVHITVNNFSVMLGRVFLGWTSTQQRISVLLKDSMQCLRWSSYIIIPWWSRRDIVLASSVHPSILTFCQSGTTSQYLLVRFDSFLVQMIRTMDSRYPISFLKNDPFTLELLPLF